MYIVKTIVILITISVFLICPVFGAPGRYALVIGNSSYISSPLKNPVNDADDMATALKEVGFDVTIVKNTTYEQLFRSIREFGEKLKNADRASTGLFYYSGHGVQVKGQNYLLPVDKNIQVLDEVAYSAVAADLVLSKIETAGNKINIIILDACRDNPFPGSERSLEKGLAVVGVQPVGSLVVYATAPGRTASDGNERNGVFTKYLLRFMKKPGVDIEIMLREVRQETIRETNGVQVPWSNSSLPVEGFKFIEESGAAAVMESGFGTVIVKTKTTGYLFVDNVYKSEIPGGSDYTISKLESGRHVLYIHYPGIHKEDDDEFENKEVVIEKDKTVTLYFTWERP